MNRHVLLDLEVHQNRWIGFIIADIQAMEAALRAPALDRVTLGALSTRPRYYDRRDDVA
jgi:hypothetical protein